MSSRLHLQIFLVELLLTRSAFGKLPVVTSSLLIHSIGCEVSRKAIKALTLPARVSSLVLSAGFERQIPGWERRAIL